MSTNLCHSDQDEVNGLPTEDTEFKLLEKVLQVLKPFKDVMVQVSAEKYVTTSAI